MPHKITNTGNATFDDGVMASVSTLQGAANGTQASADTAARAHFDRLIALAVANGISPAVYIQARKDVGTHA